MSIPRSVEDVLASRLTITTDGARAIGRTPVGTVQVPLLTVPWRDEDADRRREGAS